MSEVSLDYAHWYFEVIPNSPNIVYYTARAWADSLLAITTDGDFNKWIPAVPKLETYAVSRFHPKTLFSFYGNKLLFLDFRDFSKVYAIDSSLQMSLRYRIDLEDYLPPSAEVNETYFDNELRNMTWRYNMINIFTESNHHFILDIVNKTKGFKSIIFCKDTQSWITRDMNQKGDSFRSVLPYLHLRGKVNDDVFFMLQNIIT